MEGLDSVDKERGAPVSGFHLPAGVVQAVTPWTPNGGEREVRGKKGLEKHVGIPCGRPQMPNHGV